MSGRADLTPIYAMIFRRVNAGGTDWVYHFPELGILELTPPHGDLEAAGDHVLSFAGRSRRAERATPPNPSTAEPANP
jgi:hypothetical protein